MSRVLYHSSFPEKDPPPLPFASLPLEHLPVLRRLLHLVHLQFFLTCHLVRPRPKIISLFPPQLVHRGDPTSRPLSPQPLLPQLLHISSEVPHALIPLPLLLQLL